MLMNRQNFRLYLKIEQRSLPDYVDQLLTYYYFGYENDISQVKIYSYFIKL